MSFILRTSLTEKALALAKRNLSLITIGPVHFPMVEAPLKRTLISLVPLNQQLIDVVSALLVAADQIAEPSDKLDNMVKNMPDELEDYKPKKDQCGMSTEGEVFV